MNNKLHFGPEDTFVLFRKPGEKDHYLFVQNERRPIYDPYTTLPYFLIHPFSTKETELKNQIFADNIYKNECISFTPATKELQGSTLKEDYLDMAALYIEKCSNEFQKLVLSRILKLKNKESDLYRTFTSLCEAYPSAFVYLLNHPSCGSWLGATPETFLVTFQQTYVTVALAGTRQANNEAPGPDWPEKDKHEQQLVSDYISHVLNNHNVKFEMEGPFTHNAGNVDHLISKFHFNKNIKSFEFIDDLHPTPAVCGLPKESALSFILENEKHSRKLYTGYLGPVNFNNSMDLFVNLRCLELSKDEIVLYLGGGIVSDSIPIKEWEETEHKSRTLLNIISSG